MCWCIIGFGAVYRVHDAAINCELNEEAFEWNLKEKKTHNERHQ